MSNPTVEELIDHLVQAEGSAVTIFHPNPDFGGPNRVIEVFHDFTEESVTYAGDTVRSCLEAAITAMPPLPIPKRFLKPPPST